MNSFQILTSSTQWLSTLPGLIDFPDLSISAPEAVIAQSTDEWVQYAFLADSQTCAFPQSLRQLLEKLDPLQLRVIFLGTLSEWIAADLPTGVLHAVLAADASPDEVQIALRGLYELHHATETVDALEVAINRYSQDLDRILTVGKQLSAERDHERLLRMMLEQSMDITGADAGSIFLVEQDDHGKDCLRFAYTETRSLIRDRRFEAFIMPLSKSSLAGYVSLTGNPLLIEDVYEIDVACEYSFDPGYDRREGYRTKSMLVVPLINHKGENLGAIQLINAKEDSQTRARSLRELEEMIVGFTIAHQELVMAIAGQAAVAIENNRLYHSIESLFEGFVEASVTAIESRDPTTSGHSFRVAELTVELARNADQATEGPFSQISLSHENLKEIRYASLLHDFGKVGVREEVLVKPKKLHSWQLTQVVSRFEWLMKEMECRSLRDQLKTLEKNGRMERDALDKWLDEAERIRGWLDVVRAANEPTVLDSDSPGILEDIACYSYVDHGGGQCRLISEEEQRVLSIPRGSLTPEEWKDMQSHVSHTYEFLRRIPWTTSLGKVPEIAWAHHEKLDGSGYPRGLKDPEIPLGSRMMTIADIYDALTASDRPYKKAVSHEKALDILSWEATHGKVDAELLDLFVQRRVFRIVSPDS